MTKFDVPHLAQSKIDRDLSPQDQTVNWTGNPEKIRWSPEAIPNPFSSVRAKLVSLSLEKVASSSKNVGPPKSPEKTDSDEIRNGQSTGNSSGNSDAIEKLDRLNMEQRKRLFSQSDTLLGEDPDIGGMA